MVLAGAGSVVTDFTGGVIGEDADADIFDYNTPLYSING
jgi:hypothetical protein